MNLNRQTKIPGIEAEQGGLNENLHCDGGGVDRRLYPRHRLIQLDWHREDGVVSSARGDQVSTVYLFSGLCRSGTDLGPIMK